MSLGRWRGVAWLVVGTYFLWSTVLPVLMARTDGFPVVTVEQATGTVLLDLALLRTQFQL
mgnify:CR=1 FL=1